MAQIEPALVAARLRRLIGADTADLAAVADHLGVTEAALRISIDPLAARPMFEVIVSVIREYGVDRTWLLTGEYCSGHRAPLADVGEPDATFIDFIGQELTVLPPVVRFAVDRVEDPSRA